MHLLTSQEAYKMAFIWVYKGCPCCGRVMPDSRKDQLGTCQLCGTPRKLVDKPIGWDMPAEKRSKAGAFLGYTTLWMQAWMNRPPEKLCEHERRGLKLA